ncbi:DUF1392 family protein [Komarekiella delphini-convector]
MSPLWGQDIPPLSISLLERVYLTTTKSFGYCYGVEWLQHELRGSVSHAVRLIPLNNEVVYQFRLLIFECLILTLKRQSQTSKCGINVFII